MTPESILQHHDEARLWPQGCRLDLAAAYQSALAVRTLRMARGERPVGYKVGFTNRTIWDRYKVFAPIWGAVWNNTLSFCEGEGRVNLAGTCQPRIEPEAVFGMAHTPPPGASLQQLFESLDWVAPGFEIVQSHMPDWKFAAADTVADGGLHARLLVGPRRPVRELAADADAFEQRLATARVRLRHGEEVRDQGQGANVLDGPLHALLHVLQDLRACPGAPDLNAGDAITTGTWTDAWPVLAGQSWTADFDAPLARLTVNFD